MVTGKNGLKKWKMKRISLRCDGRMDPGGLMDIQETNILLHLRDFLCLPCRHVKDAGE